MLNVSEYHYIIRKLATSSEDASSQVYNGIMPDGVKIDKVHFGYGLFATKFFAKESIVYIASRHVIPDEQVDYELTMMYTGEKFLINTMTHAVKCSENKRHLYLFDSFLNHSCDPNTVDVHDRINIDCFKSIALRDIYPGDQLTCDYSILDYDGASDPFVCQCGAHNCTGINIGFKSLTLDEKKKRLNYVDLEVLLELVADPDNKVMFIPSIRCPYSQVSMEPEDQLLYKLIAQRDFIAGEILYSNESLTIPANYSIIIEVNGKRHWWIDDMTYMVNKGGGKKEFFYFDSFLQHSCNPNTLKVYHTENIYDVVAIKDIRVGEELTSYLDNRKDDTTVDT
jgi:hypothetical protein